MERRGQLAEALSQVSARLAASGLRLAGGFDLAPEETAPAGPGGRPARAVLLVGNAGGAFWPHFQAWLAAQPERPADPLDTWSRMVIADAAAALGARVSMPNDRPYAPFQQWAMRAEDLRPSPLGMLLHPEFGLWHAYRGALLLAEPLAGELPGRSMQPRTHPCDVCVDKPCLRTCPVGAFDGNGFAYGDCVAHLRGAGVACMAAGCLARNACPVGAAYRYPAELQVFLMGAFERAAPPLEPAALPEV